MKVFGFIATICNEKRAEQAPGVTFTVKKQLGKIIQMLGLKTDAVVERRGDVDLRHPGVKNVLKGFVSNEIFFFTRRFVQCFEWSFLCFFFTKLNKTMSVVVTGGCY